ncbi:hypothetical protein MPTK2_3g06930 [Marchantia polymorpha subsp. ruderalis]
MRKETDAKGTAEEGNQLHSRANGERVEDASSESSQDGSHSGHGSGSLGANKARLEQISVAQQEQAKSNSKYVHRLQEQIYGNFWSVPPIRWATITANQDILERIRILNVVQEKGREDSLFVELLHGVNEEGMNCLHLAANRGHCLEMTHLLQHRDQLCKNLLSLKDQLRSTRNFKSLQSVQRELNFEEVLKFLVSIPGIDLNAVDKKGNTPLMVASHCGHVKAVDILLEASARMDILNEEGLNCLHAAASAGHTSVVERIVHKAGLLDMRFLNVKSGGDHEWTALHFAVASDRINVLELLLGYPDIVVDTKDNEGCTPLLLATSLGYVQAVKILLRKGANTQIKNDKELNSMHVAASQGYIEVLKALREISASPPAAETFIPSAPVARVSFSVDTYNYVPQQHTDHQNFVSRPTIAAESYKMSPEPSAPVASGTFSVNTYNYVPELNTDHKGFVSRPTIAAETYKTSPESSAMVASGNFSMDNHNDVPVPQTDHKIFVSRPTIAAETYKTSPESSATVASGTFSMGNYNDVPVPQTDHKFMLSRLKIAAETYKTSPESAAAVASGSFSVESYNNVPVPQTERKYFVSRPSIAAETYRTSPEPSASVASRACPVDTFNNVPVPQTDHRNFVSRPTIAAEICNKAPEFSASGARVPIAEESYYHATVPQTDHRNFVSRPTISAETGTKARGPSATVARVPVAEESYNNASMSQADRKNFVIRPTTAAENCNKELEPSATFGRVPVAVKRNHHTTLRQTEDDVVSRPSFASENCNTFTSEPSVKLTPVPFAIEDYNKAIAPQIEQRNVYCPGILEREVVAPLPLPSISDVKSEKDALYYRDQVVHESRTRSDEILQNLAKLSVGGE